MTSFDERERAFEAKFAHDEELRFKIRVRRDYLLGLWAAELLGRQGAEKGAYASRLRSADLSGSSDEALVEAIESDFKSAGVAIDRGAIHKKMAEYAEEARRDFLVGL